jgi:hypothetical protein
MKIRIAIAISNGLGLIILAVAMQVEKFYKEINKMRINDNYQDYRFTSSIKGRNNLAPRKRRIEKIGEEDFEEALKEATHLKKKKQKRKSLAIL